MRLRKGLRRGHLRGKSQGVCYGGPIAGMYGLFCFQNLERRNERNKGTFVVKSANLSTNWPLRSIKMDTFPRYVMDIEPGDHFLSFDMKSGYSHFRLAPGDARLDYFLVIWAVFQKCCPALRLGPGPQVAHSADGSATEANLMQILLPFCDIS